MKAQITLEYLALMLVFLVMLSFSFSALYSIKLYSEEQIYFSSFSSEVHTLEVFANDLCALGSGNKRIITLDSKMNCSYNNKSIIFSYNSYSKNISSPCTLEGDYSLYGKILIKNYEGKIYFNKIN